MSCTSKNNASVTEGTRIATTEEMRKRIKTNGVIVIRKRPYSSKSRIHSTHCHTLEKFKREPISDSKEYWWFPSLGRIGNPWHENNLGPNTDIREYICRQCAKLLEAESDTA